MTESLPTCPACSGCGVASVSVTYPDRTGYAGSVTCASCGGSGVVPTPTPAALEAGARAAVAGWHEWDTLTVHEREQWTALVARVVAAVGTQPADPETARDATDIIRAAMENHGSDFLYPDDEFDCCAVAIVDALASAGYEIRRTPQ